jgi:hypothetical protein
MTFREWGVLAEMFGKEAENGELVCKRTKFI